MELLVAPASGLSYWHGDPGSFFRGPATAKPEPEEPMSEREAEEALKPARAELTKLTLDACESRDRLARIDEAMGADEAEPNPLDGAEQWNRWYLDGIRRAALPKFSEQERTRLDGLRLELRRLLRVVESVLPHADTDTVRKLRPILEQARACL